MYRLWPNGNDAALSEHFAYFKDLLPREKAIVAFYQ